MSEHLRDKFKKKIIYIGEKPIDNNHAGNKARVDIDKIFEHRYITSLRNLISIEFKNVFEKVIYVLDINNWNEIITLRMTKHQNIFLQYPSYYNFLLKDAVYSLIENNNCVLVVHDVDSLRAYGKDAISQEIDKFNKCKAVIVHNLCMKTALSKYGCNVPMINLNLFDYLLNDVPQNIFYLSKVVAFAGNLGKSEFIRNADFGNLGIKFNFYGPNFDRNIVVHRNVEYKGSFKPDEIPYKLEGSFGLIWDGNSIETCTGGVGEYMKYNNPHKLSLYIAAGLPVIVWKEAATAEFVEENNIGFTVSSLNEIESKIDGLSNEVYSLYLKNIRQLQEKVCSGYFTNKALDEAEKCFEL